MKREIKFRAWDEGNKKMHTNVFFLKTGDNGNDWIVFSSEQQRHKTEGNKIVFDNPYFSQQIILMQFTGLHDKNGKEIYEGDILQLWPEETKDQLRAIVIFEDGAFQYQYITKTQSPDKYRFEHHKMNCHEVIGNIYENPNILT